MENDLSTRLPDAGAMAVRLRLDATPENVMLVRQTVEGAAREFGADGSKIDDMKLAVTEACSNVVKYAYRGETGDLTIGIDPVDDGVAVLISDTGSWLNRRPEDADVGGLGIPLMEAVSRECTIDTDEGGTTVFLEFSLSADDARGDESGADV